MKHSQVIEIPTAQTPAIAELTLTVEALLTAVPKSVETEADLNGASELLSQLAAKRKNGEAFFKQIEHPIQVAVKTVRGLKELIVGRVEKAERTLRQLIGDYHTKQRIEQERKQSVALKQFEKERAEAPEEIKDLIVPPVVAPATNRVGTSSGTVMFRKEKRWLFVPDPRITSLTWKEHVATREDPKFKALADKYFVLDWKRVTADVEKGVDVPEVAAYEEDVPVVR